MKNKDLIKELTLKEKAALLGGKNEWMTRAVKRLGIPSLFMSDGPSGIRKQEGAGDHLGLHASVKATCFPSSATLANSFDTDLAEKIGEALGEEAACYNVDVLLGPGLNIKRNPLCGRNFEYMSEDPYLAGKMAAAEVRGIQSKGVDACLKHFAVNSQEERRMAMNSVIDERTLREIYLTAFEIAVKEGNAHVVMSSYNEVNGYYANENKHLLTDILRDEWNFDGMVITDWGGGNDVVEGVKAGSTLEMPAPGLSSARAIVKAVQNGTLSEDDLDERVDKLLTEIIRLKSVEGYPAGSGKDGKASENGVKSTPIDKEAMFKQHDGLVRKAVAESAVLLKNEDNILPLKKGCKVAVIGDFAFKPRYQGAGSSLVNSTRVEAVADIIDRFDLNVIAREPGYRRDGKEDITLSTRAIKAAEQADVVLYFFGLDENSESEGLDRNSMKIPMNQVYILRELTTANPNIVGILSGGSSIEMDFEDELKAILHGYLTGQTGAEGILDILTGAVNPSGHLNETYGYKYEDYPSAPYFPAKQRNSEYREGIFCGYRYFETAAINARYPFGYGLSYTEFQYSDLEIDRNQVSFKIKNAGEYDGAAVPQLYIGKKDSKIFRPVRELKGFKKVFLKSGEEQIISINLDDKAFRFFNVRTDRFETEIGNYEIFIGTDADTMVLESEIMIGQDDNTTDKNILYPVVTEFPYSEKQLPHFYSGQILEISNLEFETLLGYPIPDGSWNGLLSENDALCQMYYAKSGLARLMYKSLYKNVQPIPGKKPNLNALFQYNMPFRALSKMTGGFFDDTMVNGLVRLANGRFLTGLGMFLGGMIRNIILNLCYNL